MGSYSHSLWAGAWGRLLAVLTLTRYICSPPPKKRLKKNHSGYMSRKTPIFCKPLVGVEGLRSLWALVISFRAAITPVLWFMSTSSLWALFLLEARAHCPLRDDEAITLSGIFYCDNEPSSGCSCRRVFAYSHQKLKVHKVTTLEAMIQPALWFTLFEHLLQFSVKNVLQKYCLHRTAVKISWTCKGRGKKCANL